MINFSKKNVKSWFFFAMFSSEFFHFSLYDKIFLLGKFSQKLTFSKSSWNCLIV